MLTESKHDETAQTLNLMSFTGIGEINADVALGHVGVREMRRAVLAKYGEEYQINENGVRKIEQADYRYEYAIFRDDERALFNVRPDETDAKPVTVFYIGRRAEQL